MRKIVFLTGTRADFGKQKSLINKVKKETNYQVIIFITGMHNLKKYGYTWEEIKKENYKNIFRFNNQKTNGGMDIILSKTVNGFSKFVKEVKPDLIVYHGDRIEALAGAIVGSLNNILTAHIEGGELSGTIDESIRHSVSKLSHYHFVSNKKSERRLIQMGENKKNIFIIGSPDIDLMYSKNLPTFNEMKKRYKIDFEKYSICIYHPVTTENQYNKKYTDIFFKSLELSKKNYIIIYPNNDTGSDYIFKKINTLKSKRVKKFPSMRFEFFLTCLKHSEFIIGNSSAGIREASYYGIPAINVGSRQQMRERTVNIYDTGHDIDQILNSIDSIKNKKRKISKIYGNGKSDIKFLKTLNKNSFWKKNLQKIFFELDF
jgi:UDP-N-acetylglucosamine 2-epimerase (hydrolysing)